MKGLFKDVIDDPELYCFFADHKEGRKLPSREYFFNVLNTVQPNYVSKIVKHAQSVRFDKTNKEDAKETIEMTEKWHQTLLAHPFFSCKYYS